MTEEHPVVVKRDVNLFLKDQIIGSHRAKKISKEYTETTKIVLRAD